METGQKIIERHIVEKKWTDGIRRQCISENFLLELGFDIDNVLYPEGKRLEKSMNSFKHNSKDYFFSPENADLTHQKRINKSARNIKPLIISRNIDGKHCTVINPNRVEVARHIRLWLNKTGRSLLTAFKQGTIANVFTLAEAEKLNLLTNSIKGYYLLPENSKIGGKI